MLETSSKASSGLPVVVMQGPTDYFDRTYVVNLIDRKDRLKQITSELQTLGLTFQDAKVRLLSVTRPKEACGFPTPGVRGCFLSHLTLLLQAQADGLRNVLIMEDDLTIAPGFKRFCTQLLQQAEESPWGFIYFGHRVENTPELEIPRLARYNGPIATTHFYAVNAPVFGRLIHYLQAVQLRKPGDPIGGPMHYDGALTMFRQANPDIQTLVAQPSLGGQRSSRSDINGSWYDKVWGLRNLGDIARASRHKHQADTRNRGAGR